jgi:hypothetical protein
MVRSVWVIATVGIVAGVALAFFLPAFDTPPPPQLATKPAAASPPAPAIRHDETRDSFPDARRAIIRMLKDPDSARFGRIFEGRGVIGKTTICGEVNARNGFGGYTGMTPFL